MAAILSFLIFLSLLMPQTAFCADAFPYTQFYDNDAGFKQLDSSLNEEFKKAMNESSWREQQVLRDEQRKWRMKLFPELVRNRSWNKKPELTAREVLQERVDDLDKLRASPRPDNILGMPISFGLSRAEVGERLKLADLAPLNARPQSEQTPIRIKLFGEEVGVYFHFADTKIISPDKENAEEFYRFLTTGMKAAPKINGASQKETVNAYIADGYATSFLYEVTSGDLESREDFEILNEELAKKYKRAFPQYPPLAAFLEADEYQGELTDEGLANSSTEFIYEDKERYIIVAGSWGTLTGQFDVECLSKKYAQMHIASLLGLEANLARIRNYNENLVFLPNKASLEDVLIAIGNRELTYSNEGKGWSSLEGEYKEGEEQVTVTVHLTPENRAYAVAITYLEDDAIGKMAEVLAEKLGKKYAILSETPMQVMKFVGYGNNFDQDFESEDNYIHFGTTPHYAIQHSLTIVNKIELAKYSEAQAEKAEQNENRRQEHLEDVRRDSAKF